MALILSISKTLNFMFTAIVPLMGIIACTHNKNAQILGPIINKPIITNYTLGPTSVSKIFLDKTAEFGLSDVKAVHLYAVDINNDGFTDLVTLEDFHDVPRFYIFNNLDKKFKLSKSPFNEVIRASFLNFVDLDHDGIFDVIVGSLNQKTEMTKYPPRIFRGELQKGELVFKEELKLPIGISPNSNISVLDYDLDGELDLFLANWFDFKSNVPVIVPNELLKGSGFHFEIVSNLLRNEHDLNRSTKLLSNIAPTFGATICDVDKNGFPDILTNSSNGYYNKFWLNLENKNEREFSDYAEYSGYAADDDGAKATHGGGNSFFSACSDYNNDGIIDIAIGNLFHDRDLETRDRSSILTGATNQFPPKFLRTEFFQNNDTKSWAESDKRGIFFDYNLDGNEDFLVENSGFPPDSRLILFEQNDDHSYEDRADKLGINIVNPSGAVILDLNNDGLMDLIVGQTDVRSSDAKGHVYVFLNNSNRSKLGSARFYLQGKRSNSQGISGSTFLKTNLHNYFRNIVYNYGSLPSQNEMGIHFGFGEETPESITVNWPIGIPDRLGRIIPLVRKYNLSKLKLKGHHSKFNLCEDGRILNFNKNCY